MRKNENFVFTVIVSCLMFGLPLLSELARIYLLK